MIEVLVVDDSWTVRELLVHILKADPGIEVIGAAADGAEALALIQRRPPDVVTMDIQMPGVDGLEATRRIMESTPVPIIVVSANWNPEEVATTFKAMEAGAVALVEKPRGPGHPDAAAMAAKLVQTVKAMAEVRVIRRLSRTPRSAEQSTRTPPVHAHGPIRVVAIGASTGGPPVLKTILDNLPLDYPVPILIVQHIAAGFVTGLAEWLSRATSWPVAVAVHGQRPQPGRVYLAPDDNHLRVGITGRLELTKDAAESGLRPAVGRLFRSVADVYGPESVGVLLTGMGKDGAVELKHMKDVGAVTFAQERASCVVYGMPAEAVRLGAARFVLPPERIATALAGLVQPKGRAEWRQS